MRSRRNIKAQIAACQKRINELVGESGFNDNVESQIRFFEEQMKHLEEELKEIENDDLDR